MCHHDRFYLTAKDANTGPHASMAGALPTASPLTFFWQAFETQVNFLREVKELERNPDCQPFGSEGKKKLIFLSHKCSFAQVLATFAQKALTFLKHKNICFFTLLSGCLWVEAGIGINHR